MMIVVNCFTTEIIDHTLQNPEKIKYCASV